MAIFVSCLDKDLYMGSLKRKDNYKSKICRHLTLLFQSLIQECGSESESSRVKILAALIRPSWLGRSVCAELLLRAKQQEQKEGPPTATAMPKLLELMKVKRAIFQNVFLSWFYNEYIDGGKTPLCHLGAAYDGAGNPA